MFIFCLQINFLKPCSSVVSNTKKKISVFWLMKVRLSCQQIVRESRISHLSQFTLLLVVDKSAQEYSKNNNKGNIFFIIWIDK